MQNTENATSATLKQIQLRLSVIAGRHLTHSDLADIADVSARSIGEWMRGTSEPSGIPALLRLLASLPEPDILAVLAPWAAQKTIPNKDKVRISKGRTLHTQT